MAVHEALLAALAPAESARGWIVTPTVATTRLVTDVLFDALRTHFPHRVLDFDERARRMTVQNLGGGTTEVAGRSADRPAALLGTSLDWLIVDEAARLKEEVWAAVLSQRLVDRDGWALLLSTPHGFDSWFREQVERGIRGEEGYASWVAPTRSNPAVHPAVIELEAARLTRHEFQAEYEARFIGRFGAVCLHCGWGRDWQKTILWAPEYWARRECVYCGRPLTAEGEPVGSELPDGTVRIQVEVGPDEELAWLEQERLADVGSDCGDRPGSDAAPP
ncbi:MAG: hypothetical protein R3F49_20660 [Planctomycetota bacterium]